MRRLPLRSLAVLAALGSLALAGCGTQSGGTGEWTAGAPGADRTIRAQQVMRLTEVHEQTGMTLLEGPTFGADGGCSSSTSPRPRASRR
ncbi:SMP-30/gluconolactonase/LRE family protein [Streptomyces hirsutus]